MCILWTSGVTVMYLLQKLLSKGRGYIFSTKIRESNKEHSNFVRMSLSSKEVLYHLMFIIASRSIYNGLPVNDIPTMSKH